jgi:hypothetical protein
MPISKAISWISSKDLPLNSQKESSRVEDRVHSRTFGLELPDRNLSAGPIPEGRVLIDTAKSYVYTEGE